MPDLATADLFKLLPPEQLARAQIVAQPRHCNAGEIIFREGDPGDGLYVVLAGQVEISGRISGEQTQLLSQVTAGQLFGEMAVIEALPRSATATARQQTTVAFFSNTDMKTWLESHPPLATALLQLVSHRLREFNQHYLREVVQAERLAAVGRFARSIIHDLKNPLNIISLTNELLARPDAATAARATAQTRIAKQVDRINDLITDMLQFTEQRSITLRPTNYREFIAQIVAELRTDLEGRGVRLDCPEAAPEVMVLMEARRLRRVFYNLATNAAEAMPPDGTLTIRFRVNAGEVVTELSDNGPGIAAEMLDRVFQPFATHGKAHGTGLGLSICQKIVSDHGGQITAYNAATGGAVFAFQLPQLI